MYTNDHSYWYQWLISLPLTVDKPNHYALARILICFSGVPLATSIVDRLTAAIRVADQCLHNTQFQADVINWTEARNVMLAARDQLSMYTTTAQAMAPAMQYQTDMVDRGPRPDMAKLDGRTKEARAAKAHAA